MIRGLDFPESHDFDFDFDQGLWYYRVELRYLFKRGDVITGFLELGASYV